jgi:hypothetical protein
VKSKITMLLHDKKKLDDDFGRGTNHNLALAPLLSIVHALQCIIQHTDPHHFDVPSYIPTHNTKSAYLYSANHIKAFII